MDKWDKLEAVASRGTPPADSFSSLEYAERYSMSIPEARRKLNNLASRGIIRRAGQFLVNSHYVTYYEIVEKGA